MKEEKEKQMKVEDKKDTAWKSNWRPAMGWLYLTVCLCDFVLFPILWNIAQISFLKTIVITAWNPMTLQGAGFFHIAMGAVLGVTSYGRTQEKIEDKKIVAQQKFKLDDQIG